MPCPARPICRAMFFDQAAQRLVILGLILLMGCTSRGAVTLVPSGTPVGDVEKIFIGTTRKQESDGSFSGSRADGVRYALYEVSVPKTREVGQIAWPPRHGKADPQTQFVTAAEQVYPTADRFRANLRTELAKNGGEAVIFVHGYNTNFAEGVYRVAQFAHDLKLPGAIVEYSWPSAGVPLGYAYDRDSALWARDGLEQLIHEVAAAGAKRIYLVAHSMGSGVLMEALRTVALRADRRELGLVGGVILISPDIDVDVFREEAHAIKDLPQPFVIFGSDRDRILQLSAALTGNSERLGALTDMSRVADLKVTFMDVGAFSEGAGHFTVGESPALISLLGQIASIQGAFEADRRRQLGVLPGIVMTVQNATQVILSPLVAVDTGLRR